MKLSISPVQADDVDVLVRKVELPAHHDGPLYRSMFPLSTGQQLDEREAEIRWTADGLLQAVHQQDEILYKACGEDGLPVGFIGWTGSTGISTKTVDGSESIQDYARGRLGDEVDMKKKVRIPPSLDVSSWRDISKRLREERQRVLEAYRGNRICRKSLLRRPEQHRAVLISARNHFHGCRSQPPTARCWVCSYGYVLPDS